MLMISLQMQLIMWIFMIF